MVNFRRDTQPRMLNLRKERLCGVNKEDRPRLCTLNVIKILSKSGYLRFHFMRKRLVEKNTLHS